MLNKKEKRSLIFILLTIIFFLANNKNLFANLPTLPITIFPLNNYDQNIDDWIKPDQQDYDQELLSKEYQKQKRQDFYLHYFESNKNGLSVWSKNYVEEKLAKEPTPYQQTQESLNDFNYNNDPSKEIYGENFLPYNSSQIKQITDKIPLESIKNHTYKATNRAIVTTNTESYTLPSNNLAFHHFSIAGEGYPFNLFQASAMYVGTPVYIIATSHDQSWSYVLSADNYYAFVPSKNIAPVSKEFIKKWQQTAKLNMLAVSKTEAAITSTQKIFLSSAYIGTILPVLKQNQKNYTVLYPYRNINGKASIQKATIESNQAEIIPLKLTKRNIANLIKKTINQPYGWGNMYFYNDCSSELKNLFTFFGIWMPRNSKDQARVGKVIDKSDLDPTSRLKYLKENGHAFLTMVYIGNHVFLYLGNYQNPKDPKKEVALSYQNIWGLRPADNKRRAIIGQSVLLPIDPSYPEDKELLSLLSKPNFVLIYLE